MNLIQMTRSAAFGAVFALTILAGTTTIAFAAQATDNLRVALPAKMFVNLVEFVAQDKGYYANENLDVEFLHIANSSVPVRLLIAGDVDVIEAGMSETLVASGNGAEIKTIGAVHQGLHYAFWTREGADIESVADLPGKKVAISSPGSLPHVVTLALLRKANVPQAKIDTINWVAVSGSSARRNAILAGTVDATVASYSPKAERAEGINLLFIVGKKLPDYVMLPWDTSNDVIEEQRDVLKRFVKAELLATRWIFDNKDQALEVAKDHFDYSDEDLEAFYAFYTDGGIWDPNGLISKHAAIYMQQLNVKAGMQDKVRPVEEVLDQSITREVLDEIGRYEG